MTKDTDTFELDWETVCEKRKTLKEHVTGSYQVTGDDITSYSLVPKPKQVEPDFDFD